MRSSVCVYMCSFFFLGTAYFLLHRTAPAYVEGLISETRVCVWTHSGPWTSLQSRSENQAESWSYWSCWRNWSLRCQCYCSVLGLVSPLAPTTVEALPHYRANKHQSQGGQRSGCCADRGCQSDVTLKHHGYSDCTCIMHIDIIDMYEA